MRLAARMGRERLETSEKGFRPELQALTRRYASLAVLLGPSPGALSADPETLNDAYRAVHSMRGLAGLSRSAQLLMIAEPLGSLLSALRLGRIELEGAVHAGLLEAAEMLAKLVAAPALELQGNDVSRLAERLGELTAAAKARKEPDDRASAFGLSILLSEYEEHRLEENLRMGRSLYTLELDLDLEGLDDNLTDLKARLKPQGELIAYLVCAGVREKAAMGLKVIIGALGSDEVVRASLAGARAAIRQIAPLRAGESEPS